MMGARSREEWERFLVDHMPPGDAIDLEEGSQVRRILGALAIEFSVADAAIDELERELDPRTTSALLPDFEEMYGFPRCEGLPDTLSERRAQVVEAELREPDLRPATMIAAAAARGFEITVREYFPDTDPGDLPVTNRHRYDVHIVAGLQQFILFRAGESRAGDQLGLNVGRDLTCVLDEVEPAHATRGAITS